MTSGAPTSDGRKSHTGPSDALVPDADLMQSAEASELCERFQLIAKNDPNLANYVHLLRAAYAIAYTAHIHQVRESGELYIHHPVAVANILLNLEIDAETVIAALLHDVVEDTPVTLEQIRDYFGADVAKLVDGVTKLSELEVRPKEEAQAENYRKMFVSMADDPRVVLVKLADRLHNMRTIQATRPEKQKRIARETMEIYVPLAHRLGIGQLKWEIEDRSFAILDPDRYHEISRQLAMRRDVRERTVQRVMERLQEMLENEHITAEITGRPKNIHSIYRKMRRKGVRIEQIYDQLAVRVIVNTIPECYQVLGLVHTSWPPVPGEFDDYIANPKESMYRSLHTTVLIPGGQPCEIQIRTQSMHEVAEHGIAAHWRYKDGYKRSDQRFDEKIVWLRQLLSWRNEMADSGEVATEFVERFKADFLEEQVFVFTPRGRIIDLPVGSTPVDFAYRIHSDVGNNCAGARVNQRMVQLDYQLNTGDVVEIMTKRTSSGPSRDWLNFVKTVSARNHIRRFFKRADRGENIVAGREMLEKEFKRLGLVVALDEVANVMGIKSVDDVLAQIGDGELSARMIGQKILATQMREQEIVEPPMPQQRTVGQTEGVDIRVRGLDGMLTRIARCCNPVVGEPIAGYVTRGRGVTIHRSDCHNVLNEPDRNRIVNVNWGSAVPKKGFLVPLQIESWDRVGLWRDISSAIADAGINIDVVEQMPTKRANISLLRAIVRVQSVEQLTRLIDRLNRLPDVIEARREMGSRTTDT
jgi:guanosine-3',5'-bis(diphosphate) 3'-pyrophosphohydrolase